MSEIATEQGHYYTKSGEPCYTILGRNGKERNTNVKDARAMGLLPSVTEVLKVLAKPGLDKWKETTLLQSALTLPAIPGESLDDYSMRIIEDSKAQAKAARELGTEIHGAIERHFQCKDHGHTGKVMAVVNAMPPGLNWSAERSFAHPSGYGGKCDVHCSEWVIDFKTTSKSIDGLKTWDEHHMQLAAYRWGLCVPAARCGIIYISTEIDSAVLIEVSEEDLTRGFDMFMAALDFWKAAKKYYPQ